MNKKIKLKTENEYSFTINNYLINEFQKFTDNYSAPTKSGINLHNHIKNHIKKQGKDLIELLKEQFMQSFYDNTEVNDE